MPKKKTTLRPSKVPRRSMPHLSVVILSLSLNVLLVGSYTGTITSRSLNQRPSVPSLFHRLPFVRQVHYQKNSLYSSVSTSSAAENLEEPVGTDDHDTDDNIMDDGNQSDLPLTEERKATLFQFLLRDLQVEGVPLLGIDANQVHTLQAAVWTTMAGLLATAVISEAQEEESPVDDQKTKESSLQRVCLVFEEIPMDVLHTFVQDFSLLQQHDELQLRHCMPELMMFHMGLVGNGVGPAITISVKLEDDAVTTTTNDSSQQQDSGDYVQRPKFEIVDQTTAGESVIQATQAFVDRVVRDSDDAIGMKEPAYRYCGFADACHALSAFWNCICELQAKPDLDSIVLAFPIDFSPALTNLLNRSLGLYRGNDVFELVHYGPSYDRAAVEPLDQPAFGHLPPISWLASIMEQHHTGGEVNIALNQNLGSIANFQRRSPVAAVLIKRVDLLNMEAKENPLAASSNLQLTDGTIVSAFGLPLLAQNINRLATVGADQLEDLLDQEISLIVSKE